MTLDENDMPVNPGMSPEEVSKSHTDDLGSYVENLESKISELSSHVIDLADYTKALAAILAHNMTHAQKRMLSKLKGVGYGR